MTLGMSLVVLGLMSVYQLVVVQSGTVIPALVDWLGSGTSLGFLPNNLFLFVPLAAADHRRACGTAASGGCCSRSATTRSPRGWPASGVWQVLLALYILSALLAAVAGILVAGLVKTATLALVEQSVLPSVAAAVIGGTSIMGGRGGYSGHDRRRADPDGPDQPPHRRSRCPRPSARSCSARSSSPSPPPTRGSSTCREPRRPTPPRDRPRRHEPQVGRRRARRRRLAHRSTGARSRPSPPTARRRHRAPRRRSAGRRSERWPAIATVGVGVPGLYDPATGSTRFLVNMPGDWAGRAGRAAGRGGARPAGRADQRRAGLRPGRAAARCRPWRASLVGLTLGTGVGGVIAIDGRVHLGHDGTAGEIGHQTIDPDGPPCSCGNRGCLEAFARADRIAAACGTATAEAAVDGRASRRRPGARRARASRPLPRDRDRATWSWSSRPTGS